MPDEGQATAVIAAAGSGSRLGAGGPKALVEVAGRPLIAWSLAAAVAAESIGSVVVAAPPGSEEELAKAGGASAVVVTGADSRSGSVANALTRVETELLVVHDAARPLAPPALFDAVVQALADDAETDAVIAAAAVADTLKRTDAGLRVAETVDRGGLWAVQTPQAFRAGTLRTALSAGPSELARATDDAMLVEKAGGRVRIHPAPAWNLKLTTSDDMRVVEALLRRA